MLLCKDCKYFSAADAQCQHKSAFIPDYVNGEHSFFSASVQRRHQGKNDCTPGAQFFEPAMRDVTPILRRIG